MALKTDPKYGHYPWWPDNGDQWLHPEDVDLARRIVPSPRIFRRDGQSGDFVILQYGDLRLRVRRTLWKEVAWEGFDVGDWVEVLSRGMQNTPRTGVISEMVWEDEAREIRYQVSVAEQLIPNLFSADDLRHVDPI